MMLNVAILILFTVIICFQPWTLVIFLFFWLLDKKQQQNQLQQRVEYLVDLQREVDEFAEQQEEFKKIVTEIHDDLARINGSVPPPPKKPNLRIVK